MVMLQIIIQALIYLSASVRQISIAALASTAKGSLSHYDRLSFEFKAMPPEQSQFPAMNDQVVWPNVLPNSIACAGLPSSTNDWCGIYHAICWDIQWGFCSL